MNPPPLGRSWYGRAVECALTEGAVVCGHEGVWGGGAATAVRSSEKPDPL